MYVNEWEVKNGKESPLPKKVTPEEAAANPEIQALIAPSKEEKKKKKEKQQISLLLLFTCILGI
jgi:hypothetical protein